MKRVLKNLVQAAGAAVDLAAAAEAVEALVGAGASATAGNRLLFLDIERGDRPETAPPFLL